MITGPSTTVPGHEVGALVHGRVDVPVRGVEADRPARRKIAGRPRRRRRLTGWRLISGRWIGPMPETRRLTHSTCWVASPAKS